MNSVGNLTPVKIKSNRMPCCKVPTGRTCFLLQAFILWIFICLPMNIMTFVLWVDAPNYDHSQQYNESHTLQRNGSLFETSFALPKYCYEDISSIISTEKTFDFVLNGFTIFIVGLIGFFGNIIALIILLKYEPNSSFNKLLVGLTLIDIMLIISFVLEFSILNVLVGKQPTWYTIPYSYLIHPLKNILLSACIFMMVAVSAERCQAICHPLRERPPPIYYLLFVVVISFSLNARKYFEFQQTKDADYETTSVMEYPPYIMFSTIWQELIATGIVPFLALIYFNVKIYRKIKESSMHEQYRYIGGKRNKKVMIVMGSNAAEVDPSIEPSGDIRNQSIRMNERRGSSYRGGERASSLAPLGSIQLYRNQSFKPSSSFNSNTNNNNHHGPTNGQRKLRKRHEKSVLILILIVFVFLVCHSFRLGVQIFQTFHSTEITKDHYLFCSQQKKLHVPLLFIILNSFNNLFLIINSSVNFIIYCAVRKSFRKSFYSILKIPFQHFYRGRQSNV